MATRAYDGIYPSSIDQVFIGLVNFTIDSLPGRKPHSLPVLTSLGFEDVKFDGPVRKYFQCPKLREISYRATTDGEPEREDEKNHYEDPVSTLFDEPFFRAVPNLEAISLEGLTLDNSFVTILQSCLHLQSLAVDDCRMKEFISPFTKSLEDAAFFPSLTKFQIDGSWPAEPDMSYEDFVRNCIAKRSAMRIFGNERVKVLDGDSEDSEPEMDIELVSDSDYNFE
jgi:hypothetical protein